MAPSKAFALAFLGIVTAASIGIAAGVAFVDPYWLWRREVSWHANSAFENRMRFVKTLQAIVRQPDVVLLGSSVVYRGLNPADAAAERTYNLGISSLRIREAEVYVRLALRWVRPRTIVLGVDYFAFDKLKHHEAGFEPSAARLDYLLQASGAAFLSGTAVADAWRLQRNPQPDSDGRWQRNGFKATRPRDEPQIADLLRSTRTFFSTTEIDRDELAALERIIAMTRNAGVELKLFIPPYHGTWLDALRQSIGAGLTFESWADAIVELARRHGVETWDFANANPFMRAPMGEGSLHYLDPSHFSPLLGSWILKRLGVGKAGDVPEGFGRRVT